MILDKKYQTGVLWQDLQHKEWMFLLNQLKVAKRNHKEDHLFNQTVSFLVMYVIHHFGIEEEYMKKYEYPEEKFHIEEHRLCILRLKDFREKHHDFSQEAIDKLIESMSDWIYSHIMENDQKLGAFILKKEQPN